MSKTWGFFLASQYMVISHRAEFQLIISFFLVKAFSTELILLLLVSFSNSSDVFFQENRDLLKNWNLITFRTLNNLFLISMNLVDLGVFNVTSYIRRIRKLQF